MVNPTHGATVPFGIIMMIHFGTNEIFFIFFYKNISNFFLYGSWPRLPVLDTGIDDTSSGGHLRQSITDIRGHHYGRQLLGSYESLKLAINIRASY